jgi:hypothetical protein
MTDIWKVRKVLGRTVAVRNEMPETGEQKALMTTADIFISSVCLPLYIQCMNGTLP